MSALCRRDSLVIISVSRSIKLLLTSMFFEIPCEDGSHLLWFVILVGVVVAAGSILDVSSLYGCLSWFSQGSLSRDVQWWFIYNLGLLSSTFLGKHDHCFGRGIFILGLCVSCRFYLD
jgi:hypothetical protein